MEADGVGTGPDVLTLSSAELESQCATLKAALQGEGVDVQRLDRFAPGGAENAECGARAWYRYFRKLDRAHGRLEEDSGSGGRGLREGAIAATLAAALAEEPIPVQFVDGTVRAVYPKSYHALAWLDSLDRQHLAHAEAARVSAVLETVPDLKVFALGPLQSSRAHRTWLWILTHPGPGLPFDETKSAEPPRWTQSVAPEDFVKVFEAHLELHQARLRLIAQRFPSEGSSESRLPLAGFIGALAAENGVDARLYMRVHSLGKLFATSIAAAEASREARRRAEDKAERRTGVA